MNWTTKTYTELTKEELYSLLRLRAQVFVVEQDCSYQDLDNKDQRAIHVFCKEKDEIIAYTRIFKAGDYFQESSLGRVVVHPKERGKGLAKEAVRKSVNYIDINFSNKTCRISAQTYLKKFYKSFGFKQVGIPYQEDGLPHIAMVRK